MTCIQDFGLLATHWLAKLSVHPLPQVTVMSIILHEILYCFQLFVHPGHICKFSLLPAIKHFQMFWLAGDKNFSRPIMHTEWYCCKCFLMYCFNYCSWFLAPKCDCDCVKQCLQKDLSQIPHNLNVKQYTYTCHTTKHVIKRLFGFKNLFILNTWYASLTCMQNQSHHLQASSTSLYFPITQSTHCFNFYTAS